MAILNYIPYNLKIKPQPVAGTQASVTYNSMALQAAGLNMQILIAVFLSEKSKIAPKSVTIMGHCDTGAGMTSIDIKLAELLGMVPVGTSTIYTANGKAKTKNYIVSVSFPNTNLKPFDKLQINSCNLGFDISQASNAQNFGILIGRDIMSRWNIVWNGPTSSVFISD
jgi:hypothetical protein